MGDMRGNLYLKASEILTATLSLLRGMIGADNNRTRMPDREVFLQSLPRTKTYSGAILAQDRVSSYISAQPILRNATPSAVSGRVADPDSARGYAGISYWYESTA